MTSAGEDEAERRHVAETAREEKMTYPAYLDTDGVWSDKAGVHGIPVFLVVDREGKLAYRHAGKLTDGSAPFSRLEAALDQALARKL